MKEFFSLTYDGSSSLPRIVYLYDTSALMRLLKPKEYFSSFENNGGMDYLDRIGFAVLNRRIRTIPLTYQVYQELCQMVKGKGNRPYRRPVLCDVEDDHLEKPLKLIILGISQEEFEKTPYSLMPKKIGKIDLSSVVGANMLKEKTKKPVKIVTNDGDFDRIRFHFREEGFATLADYEMMRPPEFVRELGI